MKTKSRLSSLVLGTPEYVVAHNEWKKGRKKNPSMSFLTIKNPRRALSIAKNYAENYSQFPEKRNDLQYEDAILADVKKEKSGWSITTGDGMWLWVNKEETSVVPKNGQLARYYGRDSHVRGIDLDGENCRYKTEEQLRNEWKQWKLDQEKREKLAFENGKILLDKYYKQLPTVYKKRFDKFRSNNPDFRWKYENFEMNLCRQSIVVAKFIHEKLESKHAIGRIPKKENESYTLSVGQTLDWLFKLPTKKMMELIPGYSGDHSGNSLAHLMRLAFVYLTDKDKIVQMRGWLSIIVGSEEFGDVPKNRENAA